MLHMKSWKKGFGKVFGMKLYDFEYPDNKTPQAYDTLLKTLKKAAKFAAKIIRKKRISKPSTSNSG